MSAMQFLTNVNSTTSAIWNNSSTTAPPGLTSPASPRAVVYSSAAEQAITVAVIAAAYVLALLGQLAVMATVARTRALHNTHFLLIVTNCVSDLAVFTVFTRATLTVFLSSAPATEGREGEVQGVNESYVNGANASVISANASSSSTLDVGESDFGISESACAVISSLSVAIIVGQMYNVALIAYERYVFFLFPLQYGVKLPLRKALVLLATAYLWPLVYSVPTEVYIGRRYHVAVLTCHLPGAWYHNLFQLVMFLLLPAGVTAFCGHKIGRLMKSSQVAPALPAGNSSSVANPKPPDRVPRRQVRLTVRMLVLISGTFWGTYVPAFVIRFVVFSLGYSWRELDGRVYVAPALILRASSVMLQLPALINPATYFLSRRDLRDGFFDMIGFERRRRGLQGTDTVSVSYSTGQQ